MYKLIRFPETNKFIVVRYIYITNNLFYRNEGFDGIDTYLRDRCIRLKRNDNSEIVLDKNKCLFAI